jgi:hypothetical protein
MKLYVIFYDCQMRLEYTLLENNKQIFENKYKTMLPSKEAVIHLIEQI